MYSSTLNPEICKSKLLVLVLECTLISGVELDTTSNSNTYLVLLKFPMNALEIKEVLIDSSVS